LQESSKEETAALGYTYRIWDLGDDINVAVRSEVDAVMSRQGQDYLLAVRTFNQGTVGASDVDWKRKLENQSAAVLAMEVKNNSNRVSRWTLAAILAGCDLMKVRRCFMYLMHIVQLL
jgi:translation initiation factor 3 subunit D